MKTITFITISFHQLIVDKLIRFFIKAMRVILFVFCISQFSILEAQRSSKPEFLRIIKCPRVLLDSSSSWHIYSNDLRIPAGGNQLLVHRSGRMIELPPGNYNIDSLSTALHVNAVDTVNRKNNYQERGCFLPIFDAHVLYGYKPKLINPPFILLPGNPQRISYLPSTDTLVILTTHKSPFRAAATLSFDKYFEFNLPTDSIVRIGIKQLEALKGDEIIITLSIPNRPDWEDRLLVFKQLPNPAEFEAQVNEYRLILKGASEAFTTISMAYFYENHQLFIEAHALLQKLYDKDKVNEFYEAVYFYFLERNSIMRYPWKFLR